MFGAEDLAEEGMIEFVNPRSGDAHEGEFYREKGDSDLHIPREGTREREGGGGGKGRGRRRVHLCILAERYKLEIFRLARDLPSISSLIAPSGTLTGTAPVSIRLTYLGTRWYTCKVQ